MMKFLLKSLFKTVTLLNLKNKIYLTILKTLLFRSNGKVCYKYGQACHKAKSITGRQVLITGINFLTIRTL